jgi:hypothetical protein
VIPATRTRLPVRPVEGIVREPLVGRAPGARQARHLRRQGHHAAALVMLLAAVAVAVEEAAPDVEPRVGLLFPLLLGDGGSADRGGSRGSAGTTPRSPPARRPSSPRRRSARPAQRADTARYAGSRGRRSERPRTGSREGEAAESSCEQNGNKAAWSSTSGRAPLSVMLRARTPDCQAYCEQIPGNHSACRANRLISSPSSGSLDSRRRLVKLGVMGTAISPRGFGRSIASWALLRGRAPCLPRPRSHVKSCSG